mmetsp:Transcript_4446/g.28324  ORF Transcript_4446/g.28324 Transcript_4446/m.28324 type:complete len:81 (-) Transcript_4446:148-390(-)
MTKVRAQREEMMHDTVRIGDEEGTKASIYGNQGNDEYCRSVSGVCVCQLHLVVVEWIGPVETRGRWCEARGWMDRAELLP